MQRILTLLVCISLLLTALSAPATSYAEEESGKSENNWKSTTRVISTTENGGHQKKEQESGLTQQEVEDTAKLSEKFKEAAENAEDEDSPSVRKSVEYCRSDPGASLPDGSPLDRINYCSNSILEIEIEDCSVLCTPIGTIKFRQTTWGTYTGKTERKLIFHTELDKFNDYPAILKLREFSFVPYCEQTGEGGASPCAVSEPVTRTLADWEENSSFTWEFESSDLWLDDRDKISNTFVGLKAYQGTPEDEATLFRTPTRCDSSPDNQQGLESGGCIFYMWMHPSIWNLQYKLGDGENAGNAEAADHIIQAQQQPDTTYPPGLEGRPKVIPGAPATRPLYRVSNNNPMYYDNHAVKERMCPLLRKKIEEEGGSVANKDCDEYPMRSTFEGAASGPNYSLKYINSSHNRSAGGSLIAFYKRYRILGGDAFYVYVEKE